MDLLMKNLLMQNVEYRIEKTGKGTWRRFMYPNGGCFEEYKSDRIWFGLPLIHYTRGICPETGKRVFACGVIAIGRLAAGVLAVGHASFGVIAVGQLAVGLLFGLGQAACGVLSLGQIALGVLFGLGQITTGYVSIGQFAIGNYVLAQMGFGRHVWSQELSDPTAMDFFRSLLAKLQILLKI
ncbi:MAG: hypothetical protein A4E74_00814 [Syntrophus sp. PtaB.Bin075]|nr:MAG: hypothetical protein A4E74_00814 [Syntrophus sp. PtaB.Bin075]